MDTPTRQEAFMLYKEFRRAVGRVVVSALTGAALIGSTVGCYGFRPNSTPSVGTIGRVTVALGAPVGIVRGKANSDTLLLRSISQLEGTVIRATADELALKVAWTSPYSREAAHQLAIVPRSSTTDFAARQLMQGRTMVLVAGLSVVAIVIYAALTWDIGFGDGSSGGGYQIHR
jgi:hypothetical protein